MKMTLRLPYLLNWRKLYIDAFCQIFDLSTRINQNVLKDEINIPEGSCTTTFKRLLEHI